MDRNDDTVDALLRRGIQQQVGVIGSPGSLALRARESVLPAIDAAS